MILLKLRRETLRFFLQITSSFPYFFTNKARRSAKMKFNELQRDEGKLLGVTYHRPPKNDDIKILDLSQTSGFGETVHPDILFIQEGFGNKGWKYLMTITPFPKGIVYFENPEFMVSHDGLNWDIPEGGCSPLIPAPDDWIGYNSDPSLLYDNGILYLIYREVRIEEHQTVINIFMLSSDNGIKWNKPERIVTKTTAPGDEGFLMSQTLLKRGDRYIMWYVDSIKSGFSIFKIEGRDIFNTALPQEIHITGMPENRQPWHIDVVEGDSGKLIMAICVKDKNNKERHAIILADSEDDGNSWQVFGESLEPGDEAFCEKSLYRASLARGEDGRWRLYYSGCDNDGNWFSAVKNISFGT